MATTASSEGSVCSMSTASTKATVSGFANYDVLLSFDEETGKLCLDSTQHHVGNHRFKVLLDIHRNEFMNQCREGIDTSPIIEKLIGIVTKECVPAGRFLQPPRAKIGSDGKDDEVEELENDDATLRWNPVPEDEVVKFIERSLTPAEEQKQEQHQEEESLNKKHNMPPPVPQEERSAPEVETANGSGEQLSSGIQSPANGRLPLPVQFNNDPLGSGLMPLQNDPPLPPPPPPSSSSAAEEEKKRRRRSSLLRRSVSDQIVAVVQNLDVKKKMNRTTEERRPSLWRLFGKNKVVTSPESLDVLFSTPQSVELASTLDAVELVQNHTGNNRLQVMMEMERDKYAKTTIDEQAKMLKHWIDVVANFWKGRFLLQKNEEDPLLEEIVTSYHVLDLGQAEKALEKIMSKLVARAADAGNSFNAPLGTLFEGGSIDSFQPSQEFSDRDLEPSTEFTLPQPVDPVRRGSAESSVSGQQPAQRRRSRFAMPNFARGFSESSVVGSTSSSSVRSSNDSGRRPSTVSSAASSLPAPPTGLEHMQGMRSAAVESLQRRKKRQGLASRIQKMAETTLRRNSSIASAASNSDRTSSSGSGQNFMNRLGSFRRSSADSRGGDSSASMPPTDIPTTLNAPVAAAARRTSFMSASSAGTGGGSRPPDIPTSLNAPVAAAARRTSYMSTNSAGSRGSRGSIMGRFVSAVPRSMGVPARRTSHMSVSSVSTMGDGSSRTMGPSENFLSGEIVFSSESNGDEQKSGYGYNADGSSTDFRLPQS